MGDQRRGASWIQRTWAAVVLAFAVGASAGAQRQAKDTAAERARARAQDDSSSQLWAIATFRRPGEPLTPLPVAEHGRVLPRVLDLSRRRAAAAGVTLDPAAPLLPEQARALVAEVRTLLTAVDSGLVGWVQEYEAYSSSNDTSALARYLKVSWFQLDQLLADGKCTSERPSGCGGLWSWAIRHARNRDEWSLPGDFQAQTRRAAGRLAELMCLDERDMDACVWAAEIRWWKDGYGSYRDPWWGEAGTPPVAAKALGYQAQACAIELKGSPIDWGPCYRLAECLTGGIPSSEFRSPDACGPPDAALAKAIFRLVCARGFEPACTHNGPAELARLEFETRFGDRRPVDRAAAERAAKAAADAAAIEAATRAKAGMLARRALDLSRRRAAEGGTTFDPTAPLPVARARALVGDARTSLSAAEGDLTDWIDRAERRLRSPPALDSMRLHRVSSGLDSAKKALLDLQLLLASPECASEHPSGCLGLWHWAQYSLVYLPSKVTHRLLDGRVRERLDVVACPEGEKWGCYGASNAFLDLSNDTLSTVWSGTPTAVAQAMALGYSAQACVLELSGGGSLGERSLCLSLAWCLDDARCGPRNRDLAAEVRATACTLGDHEACKPRP